MYLDVVVPVKPDEVEWYVEMFRRNVDRVVVATDEHGVQHTGHFVAAEAGPRGVRVTLSDPRPLGPRSGLSAWRDQL